MPNPAQILPASMQPVQGIYKVAVDAIGQPLMHLIHMRTSQINGCSFCVFNGARAMKKDGETDDRIASIAAWRHSPLFTDAERAALALAEALTRIADREDPVSDPIWSAATHHFDEKQLAGIALGVSAVNVFNRLNIAVGQVASAF
ncbi:MAG: carboxymuconolactone decarboxylase family protein [Kofleriaceae bacterium]